MGSLRPLTVQAERHMLRWRTHRGRTTAIRHLDLLAVAIAAKGYKVIKLYQADELPTQPPLLWIFAFSPHSHVRIAVGVRATPGGTWAYHDARRGRHDYLAPCRDTEHAADQVHAILKHQMFPGTW